MGVRIGIGAIAVAAAVAGTRFIYGSRPLDRVDGEASAFRNDAVGRSDRRPVVNRPMRRASIWDC
jgi:hypothetical protein